LILITGTSFLAYAPKNVLDVRKAHFTFSVLAQLAQLAQLVAFPVLKSRGRFFASLTIKFSAEKMAWFVRRDSSLIKTIF